MILQPDLFTAKEILMENDLTGKEILRKNFVSKKTVQISVNLLPIVNQYQPK
jgi:hypothetical protein